MTERQRFWLFALWIITAANMLRLALAGRWGVIAAGLAIGGIVGVAWSWWERRRRERRP